MNWQLYLISSVITSVLAAYLWLYHRIHGARPFALTLFITAGWSLSHLLYLVQADVSVKLFWRQVEITFGAAASVAWVLFVLQYTGRGRYLTSRNLVLLAVVPLLTVVLSWTNALHGLMWQQASGIAAQSEAAFMFSPGPWFWVFTFYTLLVAVTSATSLLGVLFAEPVFYRPQVAVLLSGMIIPVAWMGLNSLDIISPGFSDPTPYLLLLSNGIISVGLFRYRLLDIVPLGREVLVRSMADAIVVADVYDRVVDLNPAAERIINQPATHVIGQPVAVLFAAWPKLVSMCQNGPENDERLLIADPASQRYYETHLSRLTGRRGHRIGYLITLSDMTERRAAEEALRLSEARYRAVVEEQAELINKVQEQANYLMTLIESSGSAIISFDFDGRIHSWNHAAEVTFGWDKEEAVGQVLPMVPESLRAEMHDLINNIRACAGSIDNLEVQWQRKNQTAIPVMMTMSCVRDASGNVASILSVSTDISKRKQLEQELLSQQRAMTILRERTRLARELHDNVAQVLGYVRMQTYSARQLLNSGESERVVSLLARLTEVAEETQAELRDQILGLNVRLQAGSKTAGLVRALRAYAEALGQRGSISVDFTAEPEVLDVEIDPDAEAQMIRIVQEAIMNVTKHAAAQRTLVSLTLHGDYIRATIEDNGKGFILHTNPDRETWHFGLRIMAERAEEIGGNLEIVTSPGQGTKVILNVPCRQMQPSTSTLLEHETAIA